jgi:hypothetical protein
MEARSGLPGAISASLSRESLKFLGAGMARRTGSAARPDGIMAFVRSPDRQSIELVQYSVANFSAGMDGHGGTLITDLPASSSVVQDPLVVHHP